MALALGKEYEEYLFSLRIICIYQKKVVPLLRILRTNKIDIIMKEQLLNAMRAAGKPVSAGEVAKSLNADRKEVDKAFADLKKEGAIVSPVRCKWTVA